MEIKIFCVFFGLFVCLFVFLSKSILRWLDSTIDSMDIHLSKLWETVEERGSYCASLHGVIKR